MQTGKVALVKTFIFEEINAGRIKKGHRLPSCRELAKQLSINKITVNKAYNELEKEHKVYSIPRGGFYLVDSEENQKTKTKETGVDFRTVRPDEKLIPFREFSHVMNRAIDMYKNSLFVYESNSGLISLRNTLKHEFAKNGVYTVANEIIITHGAQEALWLVLQSIFRNKKSKLLVEIPTYNQILKMADLLEIEIIGIERKKDGFDYRDIEEIFKHEEIGAFYIIPRHHNPLGYSLSEQDKRKIAELSLKYNVLMIEDDYLADLGSRKASLPIHYYDISKRTVYIRSFSKTFMPGIRIGAAVLPKFMVDEVSRLKYISDLNTSPLPQAALDLFIKSGMYEKHIKKVRKSYELKLRKAAEIFKALALKELNWHVPEHGIFIWLQLPEYIKAAQLEKTLEQQHGILIKKASEFFPQNSSNNKSWKNTNSIRLCISGVSEEDLDVLTTIISLIKNW